MSHPDLGSGSDKKKSELSHTNTSNASEEQAPNVSSNSGVNVSPASHPQIPMTNPTYDCTYFHNKTLDQYPSTLLYIGNLVVKILITTELLMSNYVYYAS